MHRDFSIIIFPYIWLLQGTHCYFLKKNFENQPYFLLLQVLRPIVSRGTQAYGWSAFLGGGCLSKESQPEFTRVSKKTTENSEQLGRQARPKIEPGTSRLPNFQRRAAQPLVRTKTDSLTSIPYPGFEPGTFGAAAGSPNHYCQPLSLVDKNQPSKD